jgi:hypothetical protein
LQYLLLTILMVALPVYSKAQNFHNYSTITEIPEPMVIDLVRGLNSKKGEWEVNTLFVDTHKDANKLQWAPEIEYVMADGKAIEFELPSVGKNLQHYKFAYQQTLAGLCRDNHLHGMQVIYEIDKNFKHDEITLFHIYAYRFNHHYSLLTLNGVQSNNKEKRFLLNPTLFYNYSHEIDFGVESNIAISDDDKQSFYQLMPQLHLALKEGGKIQFGLGMRQENQKSGLVTALRLIKEFN